MPMQQMLLGTSSNIITSNLVLYLDAGNARSYSGSGTAWNDMTAGNHHATLIHSPTYSSTSGGGSFTFDGSNDYATIPDATDFIFGTGDFTEEVWFKRTSTTGEEIAIERGNSSSWQGTRMDDLNPKPTHYTESTGSLEMSSTSSLGNAICFSGGATITLGSEKKYLDLFAVPSLMCANELLVDTSMSGELQRDTVFRNCGRS